MGEVRAQPGARERDRRAIGSQEVSMSSRSLNSEQYAFTWELPLLIVSLGVLLVSVSVHVGRALANLAIGAGWLWPPGEHFFSSLFGVLAGDGAAGLVGVRHAVSGWQLMGWVTASVSVAVVLGVLALVAVNRRWGSGAVRGTASTSEAREVLGEQRLRRHRRVIRPDLYPRRLGRLR